MKNKHYTYIILALLAAVTVFWYLRLERVETGPADTNEPAGRENEIDQAVERARQASIRPVAPIDQDDHYLGDLSAPVQLIVYEDFECPYCAQFALTMDKIREEFPGQVVIAVRHFPLRGHAYALTAALAGECAAEQDEFWAMHDKLFELNREADFTPGAFRAAARELDLDTKRFDQCLDEEKYLDRIQAQQQQALAFNVTGTPGIFINSQPRAGAVPFEDYTDSQGRPGEGMRSIIEGMLAGM